MRYIHLTACEESALKKLHKTSGNSVVRKRCFLLLYSNRNHSIQETCAVGGIHRRTLERFFTKWESKEGKEKFQFLSVAAGRGAKLKLEPLKEKLNDLVKEHNRNLNPLLHLLETQYHIKVCKSTLQAFLKEHGI